MRRVASATDSWLWLATISSAAPSATDSSTRPAHLRPAMLRLQGAGKREALLMVVLAICCEHHRRQSWGGRCCRCAALLTSHPAHQRLLDKARQNAAWHAQVKIPVQGAQHHVLLYIVRQHCHSRAASPDAQQ